MSPNRRNRIIICHFVHHPFSHAILLFSQNFPPVDLIKAKNFLPVDFIKGIGKHSNTTEKELNKDLYGAASQAELHLQWILNVCDVEILFLLIHVEDVSCFVHTSQIRTLVGPAMPLILRSLLKPTRCPNQKLSEAVSSLLPMSGGLDTRLPRRRHSPVAAATNSTSVWHESG